MDDHDWHLFDAQRGLEVRCVSGVYEIRRQDQPTATVPLTAEQWDAYREGERRDDINVAVLS